MSVTAVGTATVGEGDGGTASGLTFSATVPAGSDMGLEVSLARGFPSVAISGVTFNGSAMTRHATVESSDVSLAEIWVIPLGTLASPLTANVVVTPASSTRMAAVAQPVSGLHQTTPVNQDGGSATAADVTLTGTVAGSLVVDCYSERQGGTATPDTGQTAINTADSGSQIIAASSYEAGDGDVTVGWTSSGGNGFISALAVVELAPAASGSSASPLYYYSQHY